MMAVGIVEEVDLVTETLTMRQNIAGTLSLFIRKTLN